MRGHMASAEREAIAGSRGRAPGQGAKYPEAERFSALECPKVALLALSESFGNFAVTAKPKLVLCTVARASKPLCCGHTFNVSGGFSPTSPPPCLRP